MTIKRSEWFLVLGIIIVLAFIEAVTIYLFMTTQTRAEAIANETKKLMAMMADPQQQLVVTSEQPILVNSQVRLQDTIQAHVVADIPIDEVLTIREEVPLPLPPVIVGFFKLAPPDLRIPLEADVQLRMTIHIDQDIPVQIFDDIEFSAEVPTHTTIPVTLDARDSPINQRARIVQSELHDFRTGNLFQISAP